jgi:hypothetical protein
VGADPAYTVGDSRCNDYGRSRRGGDGHVKGHRVEPLAYQRKQAAEALGIGVDTFDRHVRPHLGVVYVGGLRLYSVPELRAWLDRNVQGVHDVRDNRKRPRAAHTTGGMAHGGKAP